MNQFKTITTTMGLLALLGFGPASAGTWTSLAPVPTAFPVPSSGVEGMSVGGVGDQIIAVAGFDNSGPGDTATTRIYDIASDTWSSGAPAPGTNSEGGAVAHGGLLYVIGGRGPGFNANWAYQPATDAWSVLSPLPTGRAGLAVAEEGNMIFAIGGRTSGGGPCSGFGAGVLATVEAYDIDKDLWTPVAPLPFARSDAAAVTVGGKIYVMGGCDAAGNILNTVDVYNPITNAWSAAPTDMPTPRAAFYGVAAKGGTIYAIGGWAGVGFGLSTNEMYKVATDKWTQLTGAADLMPTFRAEAGAVGHGGRIYIVGGAQPGFGSSVDAHEVYKP